MAYRITRFDSTPNPNALKCVLDRAIIQPDEPPRSYRGAQAAAEDAVARALFAIEPAGTVTSVLMNGDWITINKAPDADWKRVKDAVRAVLSQAD